MLELIHKVWRPFANALFPRSCFGCEAPDSYFCASCKAKIRPRAYPLDNGMRVYAALPYHSRIEPALKQLKYGKSFDIADALADLVADSLPKTLESGTEIVWIPVTRTRKNERGFNQAELVARGVAKKRNLPIADALEKIRETKPQSSLNRADRLKNLHGAFAVRAGYIARPVVVVIDDVSTTGATLTEAARALKQAGAKTVIGAVVASA